MIKQLSILVRQPNPFRFLLSRLLPKIGLKPQLNFYGSKVYLGHTKLSQSILAEGADQRADDVNFIKNNLMPGDVYVDVGANIGTLSLVAAQTIGSGGVCVAIEANPKTFQEFLANIQLNRAEIIPVLAAMWDQNGFVRFSDGAADDQNKVEENGPVAVYMTRLDKLLPTYVGARRINLLKIDVEGYEYFVLTGAEDIIDRVDKIYFEISQPMLQKAGAECQQLLQFLSTRGFVIQYPNGNPIVDMDSSRFMTTQNLVAFRRSKP